MKHAKHPPALPPVPPGRKAGPFEHYLIGRLTLFLALILGVSVWCILALLLWLMMRILSETAAQILELTQAG